MRKGGERHRQHMAEGWHLRGSNIEYVIKRYKRSHDLTHLNNFHGISKAIDAVLIPFGDDRHVVGMQ